MKIYIVGSGGVGGYFGGLLAKAGNDVTFVARGDHYRALKDNGLTVKTVVGDFRIKPAEVVESISEIHKPDLIIFTVKTYDTENTAKELGKVVSDKSTIITFQNGVENDNQIKKHVKSAKVYPGVAYVISARTTPGVIEQTGGLRKLIFGDRTNPENKNLKAIESLMKKSGIDVTLSDDITRDLWKKFLFIIPFAGLTAYYRKPIGKILADSTTRSVYEKCLKEGIEVAKAIKINLPGDIFDYVIKISKSTAPDSKSSLLIDIENGRRNEIETLNGTIIRLAKEKGIKVPINELIYNKIKLLNNQIQKN